MTAPRYKRILLKLSGEALMGDDAYGINPQTIAGIVAEIKVVADLGVEIGVVIGGGNIFRGMAGTATGMDRATADYMGMLATVMNAMALSDALRQAGLNARVQSALNIEQVVEPYIRGKAIRYLEEGKIVIFGAGTGNPFFTTDTAAALRGSEIGAEIVLKATKVDGIYTADPKKDPAATRFDRISFDDAIASNLAVMDATAFALCRDQKLPINVFSIFKAGALKRVVWERMKARWSIAEGEEMIPELKKTAEGKMQKSLEVLKNDLPEDSYRPRAHRPAGSCPGRLLRLHGAGQSGGQHYPASMPAPSVCRPGKRTWRQRSRRRFATPIWASTRRRRAN